MAYATVPQVIEHMLEPAATVPQVIEHVMEPALEPALETKPSVFISTLKTKYPKIAKSVFYGLALLSVTTLTISQVIHFQSPAALQPEEFSNQNKTMNFI